MTFENKNLRCRDCKFWWPIAEAAGHEANRERAILGQCRRHAPPAAVAEEAGRGQRHPAWATTTRDDWCGEHQHILN